MMKLSIATAAASAIASSRPALASFSGSPSLDLSKPLEDSPSLNQSPGALAVINAAQSDPATRTAMVLEDGKIVASFVRDDR